MIVPEYLAVYAINLVATNIVLLPDIYSEKNKSLLWSCNREVMIR